MSPPMPEMRAEKRPFYGNGNSPRKFYVHIANVGMENGEPIGRDIPCLLAEEADRLVARINTVTPADLRKRAEEADEMKELKERAVGVCDVILTWCYCYHKNSASEESHAASGCNNCKAVIEAKKLKSLCDTATRMEASNG